MTIATILLVLAVILLFCAAFNVTATARVSLGWLGLAFWALSLLVGGGRLALG